MMIPSTDERATPNFLTLIDEALLTVHNEYVMESSIASETKNLILNVIDQFKRDLIAKFGHSTYVKLSEQNIAICFEQVRLFKTDKAYSGLRRILGKGGPVNLLFRTDYFSPVINKIVVKLTESLRKKQNEYRDELKKQEGKPTHRRGEAFPVATAVATPFFVTGYLPEEEDKSESHDKRLPPQGYLPGQSVSFVEPSAPPLKEETTEIKQVDICFCLDCTCSMGPELDIAKRKIIEITKLAEEKCRIHGMPIKIRWAAVAYRDYTDNYQKCKHLDFTEQPEEIEAFFGPEDATGGDDTPEAVELAIRTAADKLNWRSKHGRQVFLIADAPAHGCFESKQNHACELPPMEYQYQDKYPKYNGIPPFEGKPNNLRLALEAACKKNLIIYPILVRDDQRALQEFTGIAEIFRIEMCKLGSDNLVDTIVNLIFKERVIEKQIVGFTHLAKKELGEGASDEAVDKLAADNFGIWKTAIDNGISEEEVKKQLESAEKGENPSEEAEEKKSASDDNRIPAPHFMTSPNPSSSVIKQQFDDSKDSYRMRRSRR